MAEPTDEVTWLRERVAAMTPEPWVDGAGDIFAAADLHDGMVKDDECEVASCYGRNRQPDEAGIVALRNVAPSMLAVIEAAVAHADRCDGSMDAALSAFRAAVTEEMSR